MAFGTALSYNGHDLQTADIQTADIDHFSGPTKNQAIYGVGHANYSAIPFLNFPSKTIVVTGRLVGDTIEQLDDLIDTFKGYFTGNGKYLDVGYSSSTRRYVCTPQSPQIQRPNGLLKTNFSVTFDCTLPFGRNTTATTALNATARTGHLYADNHVFVGSAPWQYPVTVITFHTITGGTNATVVLGNNANGQQTTLTRTWASGDVIEASSDPFNRYVKINGTPFDWAGALCEFEKDSQYIAYSDTFTTVNFDINVSYYPMWM